MKEKDIFVDPLKDPLEDPLKDPREDLSKDPLKYLLKDPLVSDNFVDTLFSFWMVQVRSSHIKITLMPDPF
jgi:hypothetical protein